MGEDNPIKWPDMIERPLRLKEKTCLGLEPPQVGHVEVDELQGAPSDGEQTRLSVVAGMYHQWDKQLRDWLVREIQHWHRGDYVRTKVWGVDFILIVDLLESFGWPLRSADYFKSLDACRLVVNVYKHGEGPSLQDLKERYPEYLHDPFGGDGGSLSDVALRDHTALRVSDHQFQGFDDAMSAFWRDVPENVLSSSISIVPPWFEKAILKDRKLIDKTGAKR